MARVLLIMLAAALLGAGPAAAETVDYKGRRLQGAPGPDYEAFLGIARIGIDMVDGLPPKLKALGSTVMDLRFEPSAESIPNRTAQDDIVGVYTMTVPDDPKAFISFRKSPRSIAAYQIALSLVGNGVTAQRHVAYLDARKAAAKGDAKAKTRAEYLRAVLTNANPRLSLQADCENLSAIGQTLRALDMGERAITGLYRAMTKRGC